MAQEVEAPEESARPARPARSAGPPAWFVLPAWLLTLAGLGLSVYLTVAHFNKGVMVCTTTSTVDCHSVTTSEYSDLFGIPLPLLGLAFFVGFAVLLLPPFLRSAAPVLRWARLGSVCVGVLFVVYLITAEVLLGKICLWCTGVHTVTILLFVLVLADEYRRAGQVD